MTLVSSKKHLNESQSELLAKDTKLIFSVYISALRPWSFSASFGSCLLGLVLGVNSAISVTSHSESAENVIQFPFWLRISLFISTTVTCIGVHAAGNLVNTYYDFIRGVDLATNNCDDRTLVDTLLRPSQVESMAICCYLLAVASFFFTILLSPPTVQTGYLSVILLFSLTSSFLYTGGCALKYHACGEVLIFLLFGPMCVLYVYLGQGASPSLAPLLFSVPQALLPTAILHSNNVRDLDSDLNAGIVTVAILLGTTRSYYLFNLLLFTPFIICVLLVVHLAWSFAAPLVLLPLAFRVVECFRCGNMGAVQNQLALLNLLFAVFYAVACFVAG